MRLAWFHPGPSIPALEAPDAFDLALELGPAHTVDHVDAVRAHEFVWRHARSPYDLTIFELGDTPAHAFVWAYLFHYPGIVVLRAGSLRSERTDSLLRGRRHADLRAERQFGGTDLLRAPLAASRMAVVHDASLARDLSDAFPAAAVRVVPMGVAPAPLSGGETPGRFVVTGPRRESIERAASRAREAGSSVTLAGAERLGRHDVLVALEWPPTGAPPVAALRAIAAGVPVIVLETAATAAWPTLDPQTWQPRGFADTAPPIAISIDPRDEEHSLMLALRRLAADPTLKATLGAAARAWAAEHASVRAAASAWIPLLIEAARLAPSAGSGDLPPHLTADGTAVARRILHECGAAVDFL